MPARSSDRRKATVRAGRMVPGEAGQEAGSHRKQDCRCHGKELGFYSTDACLSLQEVPISKACGGDCSSPCIFGFVLLNNESWEQGWKAMGMLK